MKDRKIELWGLSEAEEEVEIPSWLQGLNEEIEEDVSAKASPLSIGGIGRISRTWVECQRNSRMVNRGAAEPVGTVPEKQTFIRRCISRNNRRTTGNRESESEISRIVELPEWLREIESEICRNCSEDLRNI
jgi:hypothetical protein